MKQLIAVVIVSGLFLAGCQGSSPKQAKEDSPRTMTDPCAMRLHDLSGALLLYHATYQHLPPTLDGLRSIPDAVSPLESFSCPSSKQAYLYSPEGVAVAGQAGRVVVNDASPAHNGKRWAIEVLDSSPESPLVTKVVSLPESDFRQLTK